jgi:hypothetical protein
MTEAEAKGKGCPWATVYKSVYFTAAAANRTPAGTYDPSAMCQGNKCMAWLWLNQGKDDGACSLTGQSGNQGT